MAVTSKQDGARVSGAPHVADGNGYITFHANECLVKEGSVGDSAYLITSGKVAVRTGTLSSSPQTLAVLGKGEVIGEMSLFDDHPPMATVVALEETRARAITRDDFKRRVAAMDPVMRGVMKIMVKRIRDMLTAGRPQTTQVNWGDWKKKDK